MFSTLSRKLLQPLIAVTLAASLVLSPASTTQAQAHGRHDADGFIAALVALGLIGLIVTNENGRNSGDVRAVPRSRRLPAACLKSFRTNHGRKTIFTRNCLRNEFRWWRNLPQACKTNLRYFDRNGHRKSRQGYRPACLQDYGYRVIRNY